ncbi:recombinase RecT [Rhodanobacter sp. FW510-R12]|uniref:recombination protein RecT n=1 Tax=unclassified Rhodanobacter TaxID=2621553 RepID=UPI0007A9C701|nr:MULTISPECIES: recombination protein RecT [unclassified Rhodanobacter]KZC17054.1 recombinase RecT [Rhodanobacter sp. FW104-R8]KZC28578.1 recombinase RecT [Rhodanobacter sp. FW510-T8]KZC32320.1 recombinase RecT [Rhodanobacter sp. FW510-R10]
MAQQSTLKQEMQNRSSGTTAVAAQQPEHKTLAHLLTDPKIKAQMALALPKHMTADRLARIALTEIRKVPKLAQCDQTSFLGAIMQVAALGLEPGGALGHAYLIPFDKRGKLDNGQWGVVGTEVQLIIGYRGMIDLARRSGQIVSLSARIVYAKDKFSYSYGLDEVMEHVPHEGTDPGEMTHVYAVAKLVGGGVQFEVMSRAKVEQTRDGSQGYQAAVKAASKYNKPVDSPWTNHFDEMAKKTVIRQLFKYLPVSIEIQRAVGLDEQADAGVPQHNALVIDGDYRVETHDEHPAGDEPQRVATSPDFTAKEVHDALANATTRDALDAACDLINMLPVSEHGSLIELYQKRATEIVGAE